MSVNQVYRRDGKIVEFDRSKIREDLYNAMLFINKVDIDLLEKSVDLVVSLIDKKQHVVTIDEIQDCIESVLLDQKKVDLARFYILNRIDKAKDRQSKVALGITDDIGLSLDAIKILEKCCIIKDEEGKITETVSQSFKKISRNIAQAEYLYGKTEEDVIELEERFYEILCNLEFIPNLPTIMNAGKESQQLIGSFVIPVDDSIESIFESLKQTILINQFGGIVGLSFSRLRPKGSYVSSGNIASGPISFMKIFDETLEKVQRFNTEKNSFVLRIDHPDILDLITDSYNYKNFDIYVGVTDAFVHSVINNSDYSLLNPKTEEVVNRLNARNVFDLLSTNIWKNSSIRILFLDKVNRENPITSLGSIEAISVQPLMSYESIVFGSLNLSKMVISGEIDWEKLRNVTRLAVNFLDNVIEMSRYPSQEIEMMTKGNRRIGLGISGFSELLIKLNISYDSDEALKLAEDVIRFISEESKFKSQLLANDRDPYENYEYSYHKKFGIRLRNSSRISINSSNFFNIFFNSTGIEPPILSKTFLSLNNLFETVCKNQNVDIENIKKEILEKNSITVSKLPENITRLFKTKNDISPYFNLKLQYIFEKYSDASIDKEIIISSNSGINEIEKLFIKSYDLGLRALNIKINYIDFVQKIQSEPVVVDVSIEA